MMQSDVQREIQEVAKKLKLTPKDVKRLLNKHTFSEIKGGKRVCGEWKPADLYFNIRN